MNLKLKPNIFLIACIFSATLSIHCFADKIYLKNGRTMRGVVEKEDEKIVTLNVGVGRISFKPSEIDHIEKSDSQEQKQLKTEWKRKYFFHSEFSPERLREIAAMFRELESTRTNTITMWQSRTDLEQEIEKTENNFKQLTNELSEVSKTLSTLTPQSNPQGYNNTVTRFNSLTAQIQLNRNTIEQLKTKSAELGKNSDSYRNLISQLKARVAAKRNEIEKSLTDDEKYFIEGLNEKIAEMENDFVKHDINYQQTGSHVLVTTLINNNVSLKLIVDTGASLVVIYKDVASKFNLDKDTLKGTFQVTVADGRKIDATPAILKSVKIGDVEITNVTAAILARQGTSNEDGLLGMSFLENFSIRLDGKNNRLFLEEFRPKN